MKAAHPPAGEASRLRARSAPLLARACSCCPPSGSCCACCLVRRLMPPSSREAGEPAGGIALGPSLLGACAGPRPRPRPLPLPLPWPAAASGRGPLGCKGAAGTGRFPAVVRAAGGGRGWEGAAAARSTPGAGRGPRCAAGVASPAAAAAGGGRRETALDRPPGAAGRLCRQPRLGGSGGWELPLENLKRSTAQHSTVHYEMREEASMASRF